MNSGIYKIENLKTGDFYIGSAEKIDVRRKRHFWLLKNHRHHCIHLQRAWDKYGEENFSFEIIEFIEDQNSLISMEQKWMDLMKPQYNVNPTAGSSKGFKHSEETKRKLREMNLGSKNPMFGFKYPEKIKSKSPYEPKGQKTGKTYNLIKKKVIRISQEGDVKEYQSITEAALDLGTNRLGGVQHVLQGRKKSYKGYFFKYKNPEDCP